jgi:hypothetical protein
VFVPCGVIGASVVLVVVLDDEEWSTDAPPDPLGAVEVLGEEVLGAVEVLGEDVLGAVDTPELPLLLSCAIAIG